MYQKGAPYTWSPNQVIEFNTFYKCFDQSGCQFCSKDHETALEQTYFKNDGVKTQAWDKLFVFMGTDTASTCASSTVASKLTISGSTCKLMINDIEDNPDVTGITIANEEIKLDTAIFNKAGTKTKTQLDCGLQKSQVINMNVLDCSQNVLSFTDPSLAHKKTLLPGGGSYTYT